jgi:hypothetical protein
MSYADVSALPTLHPGQAQVGMVVSWQKWSCSSATSWQPQLSRVTAIVLGIDDDSAALDVCLAKRDRYLDGTEKRYDHRTGQRIYDKFEAPDLDEEDGDDNTGIDEGYRTVSWVCVSTSTTICTTGGHKYIVVSKAHYALTHIVLG